MRCYRLTFDRLNLAAVLLTLGGISRIRGDLDTATRDLRESLILSQELSDPGNIAACIEGLAGVDLGEGRFEHGARLLGAAKALRDATGASALPTSDALNAGIFDAIRAALAGGAFDAAIAEGSAMTQAGAVTYALVDAPPGA